MSTKVFINVDGKEYVKASAMADRWDCKPRTITEWCQRGKIPGAFKVGNRLWYLPEDSIRPLTDTMIRNMLLLVLKLKNDLSYVINYEELGVEPKEVERIYHYLMELKYVARITDDTEDFKIAKCIVVTDKGMQMIEKLPESTRDKVDIAKLIREWLPTVLELVLICKPAA